MAAALTWLSTRTTFSLSKTDPTRGSSSSTCIWISRMFSSLWAPTSKAWVCCGRLWSRMNCLCSAKMSIIKRLSWATLMTFSSFNNWCFSLFNKGGKQLICYTRPVVGYCLLGKDTNEKLITHFFYLKRKVSRVF